MLDGGMVPVCTLRTTFSRSSASAPGLATPFWGAHHTYMFYVAEPSSTERGDDVAQKRPQQTHGNMRARHGSKRSQSVLANVFPCETRRQPEWMTCGARECLHGSVARIRTR